MIIIEPQSRVRRIHFWAKNSLPAVMPVSSQSEATPSNMESKHLPQYTIACVSVADDWQQTLVFSPSVQCTRFQIFKRQFIKFQKLYKKWKRKYAGGLFHYGDCKDNQYGNCTKDIQYGE